MSTHLVDLLPHTRGDADQVVVAQTLEEGQASHKLEGARTWRMPHHKLHTHIHAHVSLTGTTTQMLFTHLIFLYFLYKKVLKNKKGVSYFWVPKKG